jgi:flagellar biosynthesis protein
MTEKDPQTGALPSKRSIAVAIEDRSAESIPVVTAAAHGALAEELLRIAFEHGVPVREDAGLAEILQAIEVDTEIPVAAFAAVAEILAYVYRADRAPID